MYERILVALDGSEAAEGALPYVEELAEKFGSRIILLRATTEPEEVTPVAAAGFSPATGPILDVLGALEAEVRESSTYLAAIADILRREQLNVEYVQRDGTAAAVILEQARAHKVDLIAMTTHGRGGVGRAVLGSVADAVLRAAPCAVLLVRLTDA